MYILGIDLETSGLDTKKDQIIELAAVLWDLNSNKPVQILSEMIFHEDLKLSEEVKTITQITDEDLRLFGQPLDEVLERLSQLADSAHYIVAHNGRDFDFHFLNRYWQQKEELNPDLPWIDTLYDVPYPAHIQTRKLTHLAAEHAFLNPFNHRALFDVLTMMKVLSCYDFSEVVELSQSPVKKVRALVSFEQKDLAKQAGFRWDAQAKFWIKELKEMQLKEASWPFQIEVLN